MADIFDLVDAKIQGDFIVASAAANNEQPYVGAELFPARKQMELDLKFIVGYNSLPVSLKPSTLGSRAFTRERIGAATVENEIPFFREQMPLDERTRRKLTRAINDATDPYTKEVLTEIFNDTKQLVDGANVVPERMRMGLLFNGKFSISGAAKDGVQPKYDYDYDPNGKWAQNNVKVLTAAASKWSNVDSTPVDDLQEMIDKAADKGFVITRGLMNRKTLKDIMNTTQFKNLFKNLDGSPKSFSRNDAIKELQTKLGITIAVSMASYKDENGDEKDFITTNGVALFGNKPLGRTVYATTPEELDLQTGYGNASVSVVNTGVTVTTAKEYGPPVTVKTVVSEFVLPSFEGMNGVFVIRY